MDRKCKGDTLCPDYSSLFQLEKAGWGASREVLAWKELCDGCQMLKVLDFG